MRYIIDVTQLVHWPGNLTGIPRVMDELSIRFLQDSSIESVFVSWVREVNAMCEIDFSSTRAHRGDGIDYITKPSNNKHVATSQTPAYAPLVTHTIKSIGKRAAKKLAAKSRLDRTSLYKKAVDSKRIAEVRSYRQYSPKKDDIFFIPWGEWWDQHWLDLLKSYAGNGVRLYPLCHDILPMVVPQFSGNSSSLADFVQQIFPISTAIITQSTSTKNDLTHWMKDHDLSPPPIHIFRLGEDFTIKKSNLNDASLQKKYNVTKDNYLIYVSTIEPRKNHAILYYTYKLAHAKGITLPKLIIVGRVGHDVAEIIHLIKNDPEINQIISIENDVDDDDLNWLYQQCRFAVMPSFYEGWGMSVIESIAHGKPAVIANTSSLLEMPDDCVIRFHPASTDECLSAIQEMSTPDTLKRYRAAAQKYTSHSWDDAYKQILEIFKEK